MLWCYLFSSFSVWLSDTFQTLIFWPVFMIFMFIASGALFSLVARITDCLVYKQILGMLEYNRSGNTNHLKHLRSDYTNFRENKYEGDTNNDHVFFFFHKCSIFGFKYLNIPLVK